MKRTSTSSLTEVNIATLKAKLAEYLRRVKAGTIVTILEHRTPIAQITPLQTNEPLPTIKPKGNLAKTLKKLKIPPAKKTHISSTELLREERGNR